MVINALICDDDQKCVDQISEYLDHYCYDHTGLKRFIVAADHISPCRQRILFIKAVLGKGDISD